MDDGRATRVPPHNLEAEESLLGAMLLSRDAIADAVERVQIEHFYRPAHAHVFDAISTLYAAGDPADHLAGRRVFQVERLAGCRSLPAPVNEDLRRIEWNCHGWILPVSLSARVRSSTGVAAISEAV